MLKLPLRIRRHPESYCIEDAAGISFGFVYFAEDEARRMATQRMPEADALALVKRMARAETDWLESNSQADASSDMTEP